MAPSWRETGRPALNSSATVKSGKIVARAEIALQQVLQIVQVLRPQRLIEMEDPLKIGLDDGIKPLLLVERAARSHAHQEKRDRHDHEERRDGSQKPPEDIAQHGQPLAGRKTAALPSQAGRRVSDKAIPC